jgi:FkbM family methyltransferase
VLRLKIRHPSGFALHFHPTPITVEAWVNPSRAYVSELAFLTQFLRPGDAVIDVGAHVGLLSVASAHLVGSSGRVVSIEPHPRVYGYLTENVDLNGLRNVETIQCAVGRERGVNVLSDESSDDWNFLGAEQGVEVAVSPLDELIPIDLSPSLLKVDVEGYERFVFEGARRTLDRTECVLFESWDDHCSRYAHRTADVIKLIAAHGFSLYELLDIGHILPLHDLSEVGVELRNYVGIRRSPKMLERMPDIGEV